MNSTNRQLLIASFVLCLLGNFSLVYKNNGLAQYLETEAVPTSSRSGTNQTERESESVGENSLEDNNDGNGDGNDDDRPWMVVHVGPPKTGTTTIQSGFLDVALRLAREDNVYFIGCTLFEIARLGGSNPSNVHDNSNSSNHKKNNSSIAEEDNIAQSPNVTVFRMKDFVPPSGTSQEFMDVLKSHQRKKHNVVISSEHLSHNLYNHSGFWKLIYQNLFLSSQSQTQEGAILFGFKVKIVVTYRHFFQWLPSYWAQQHENIPVSLPDANAKLPPELVSSLYPYKGYIPGIIEYVEWFLGNLPAEDNKSYSRRFPDRKRIEKGISPLTSHASIWSFLQWSSRPELRDTVDVFDMHQQPFHPSLVQPPLDPTNTSTTTNNDNSTATIGAAAAKQPPRGLFANFVCQMLPNATNTCRYLEEETTRIDARQRVNRDREKILSNKDMYRIRQAAHQRGRAIRKASSSIYIPPKVLTRWLERQKRPSNASNSSNTLHHLKRCLEGETLETLKQVSWEFLEQQISLLQRHASKRNQHPSSFTTTVLFRSSRPTHHLLLSSQRLLEEAIDLETESSSAWKAHAKAKHDESFEEYVRTGVFCEIDIEQLFQNEDFVQKVLV